MIGFSGPKWRWGDANTDRDHIKISQFQCFGSRDRCHPRSAISADLTGALNSGTLKLFLNGTLVEEVFGGQQLREIRGAREWVVRNKI